MEEKKDGKFLPIGTVVILKGGKKEMMITCYCIMPKGEIYDKDGKVEKKKGQMFDYGACLYPEGVIASEQSFAFNHEQIDKILYRGYETDTQKEFSKVLNKGMEKYKEKIKEEESQG